MSHFSHHLIETICFPFLIFASTTLSKKKEKRKKWEAIGIFTINFYKNLIYRPPWFHCRCSFRQEMSKHILIASENNLKLKFFSRGSGVKLLDNSNLGFWSISPVLLRCPGDVKIRPRLNVDTQLSYIRLGIFSA